MDSATQSPDRKTVPGLGIAQPGSVELVRQASIRVLIEDAAPMGEAAEYHDNSPEGKDKSSPHSSPSEACTPADTIRNSVHYAWDRAALGIRDELDGDVISLDSLQMHDEAEEDQPRQFGPGPGHAPRTEFGGAGLDDVTTDQTPLRGKKKAPKHVRIQRLSWTSIWLIILAVYSTIMSGIWLLVAIIEPRWGSTISTNGPIQLSTANLLTAIFAKTIEISFVTLVMAFVGQVLTRRAIASHEGMTMAEVTMRNWIAQPGSIFTNLGAVRYVGRSLLGVMALVATIVVMFYTTASDTMVRPKLRFGQWKKTDLNSTVWASYANPTYVQNICATPIPLEMDPLHAGESCLAIQYSGDSFSDFMDFLSTWHDTSSASLDQARRPQTKSMLWNNVTMVGTWIETQHSNVTQNFENHSRVVNNASLAMPHAGVYRAATNKTLNGILQPSDLDGVGSYNISASVVSPSVNVMCVNMDADELAPLVYTAWPNANSSSTAVANQTKGWDGWEGDVPGPTEWTNTTVVDDLFHWGTETNRLAPMFEMFPADYNTVANITGGGTAADSIYVLGKSPNMANYTLCALRSWLAVQCSTQFNVSGTSSMAMSAACSQNIAYYPANATLFTANPDAYVHTMKPEEDFSTSNADWRNMAQGWSLGIGLNGGVNNNNAAVGRILMELALTAPQANATTPSLAEALAALAANTLVTGAVNTPFIHYYAYTDTLLDAPEMVSFRARVRTQEYASWHTEPWQGIFYVILVAAFVLNVLCLVYLCSLGLVQDFLEPTSLFALATAQGGRSQEQVGSPEPDLFEKGTKKKRSTQMGTPYLLNYREDGGHFFFEQAADGEKGTPRLATGLDVERDQVSKRKSFGMSFDSMRRLP
ncbi:unnamed protein product [Discula destructiva]